MNSTVEIDVSALEGCFENEEDELVIIGPDQTATQAELWDWAAERRRARVMLNNAVRAGKLERPKQCAICGHFIEGGCEAHHYDYGKPLSVTWVCPQCHEIADGCREGLRVEVLPWE
jgi:hypothetical protein